MAGRLLELSDCLAGLSLAAAWMPAWPVDRHAGQVAARWLAPKMSGGLAGLLCSYLADRQGGPRTSWLLAGCLA